MASLRFQQIGFAVLVAFIGCCSCAAVRMNGTVSVSKSCDLTKKGFVDSGLGTRHLHNFLTKDTGLQICTQENTCCQRSAELEIHRQGMNSYKELAEPLRLQLKDAFSNSSEEFLVFLTQLINNSYSSLDMMFQTTYQERYETNKHVFKDLFSMLQLYIAGDEIDLKLLCENFFALLYQKVYILFNPTYSYSKSYEDCILQTSDSIKPFGDGPRKVTLQVSRSFLATRVFMEGLQTGRSVIRELLKLQESDECSRAFTKMLRCSSCSDLDGVKPCYRYCLNVMKGCYAYTSVVNKQWTDFISAMLKLANKLEGPFSVESIIEPLGVKISEAIMVFQDHKDNITAMVSKRCGNPPMATMDGGNMDAMSRKKRADFPFEFLGTGTGAKPLTAAGTNLDILVQDAKAMMEPLKGYWVRMAYNVCASGIAEDPDHDGACWNGNNAKGYGLAVVNDGIPDMFQNPEVALNISDPKIVVQAQVLKLKVMTSRIHTALHGSDSNEIDVEEGSGNVGSGSGTEGSGSGSGVDPTSEPPVTTPQTTTMGNEVDPINSVTPPSNTVSTSTMGNNIPNRNDNNDVSLFPQANADRNSKGGAQGLAVSSLTLLLLPLLQIIMML